MTPVPPHRSSPVISAASCCSPSPDGNRDHQLTCWLQTNRQAGILHTAPVPAPQPQAELGLEGPLSLLLRFTSPASQADPHDDFVFFVLF